MEISWATGQGEVMDCSFSCQRNHPSKFVLVPEVTSLITEAAFLITEPEMGTQVTPIPEIGLIAEAGSEQLWLEHNIGNRDQMTLFALRERVWAPP